MGIIRRLKWKDEKGNETEHDLGVKASNVSVDASHRFVTDEEKKAWNSKPGSSDSVKENTVEFEPAKTRANIISGETLKVMMGKIQKVIADIATVAFSGSYTDLSNKPSIPSGAAANYAVANNDTTTAAGYLADARIVRTHGLEIDQLSSDLSAVRQSFTDGCNAIVAGCTTYGATPAGNSPEQIVSAIGVIYNNRYNAGQASRVFSFQWRSFNKVNDPGGTMQYLKNLNVSGYSTMVLTVDKNNQNRAISVKSGTATVHTISSGSASIDISGYSMLDIQYQAIYNQDTEIWLTIELF